MTSGGLFWVCRGLSLRYYPKYHDLYKMFQHIAKFSQTVLLRFLCTIRPLADHRVSNLLFIAYSQNSSAIKAVYNPKAFVPHAASLDQAFAHCPKFPTAASRRSRGRVAVPVWRYTLSGPLTVIGLVGHYPTNYLMVRGPCLKRLAALIAPRSRSSHNATRIHECIRIFRS